MKDKKGFLILILVFAVVLVGASVLYTQLGDSWSSDPLLVQNPQDQQTTNTSDPAGESSPVQTDEPETTGETEAPKVLAPDFVVYDAAGNEVRLSDYIGKPIVLNFWASWCGPCKMEMPDFHGKYLEFGDQVQFLMINMTDGSRETVKGASEFIADAGYTFPVFYDTASEAAMIYGVYSLPTTFFVDAEGYVIAYANRAIDGDTLQRGIEMITQ